MIRVVLPAPLRSLARIGGEVELELEGPVTQAAILDALEARYPMLLGTTRDHVTKRRRAFIRFYACGLDLSDEAPDAAAAGADRRRRGALPRGRRHRRRLRRPPRHRMCPPPEATCP